VAGGAWLIRATLAAMRLFHVAVTPFLVMLAACGGCGGDPTPAPTSPTEAHVPPPGKGERPPTEGRDSRPTAASSDPTPTPNSPAGARDKRIPQGSGDYSGALADAEAYKRGAIRFEVLQKRVVARQLPPHPLGCAYLMTPVPQPPPGIPFDAWMMPPDWEHNFGEIAMTYWVGALSLEDYNRLHAVAHPVDKSP
jgi:hypothetical protein